MGARSSAAIAALVVGGVVAAVTVVGLVVAAGCSPESDSPASVTEPSIDYGTTLT